jgi:hypothetical protein
MKSFLFLILLMGSSAFAENEFASWKWGVGFTQQNLMRTATHFEVGSPALVDTPNYLGSFILAVDLAKTSRGAFIAGNAYSVATPKLMWEFRRPMYKGITSYYARIGAGYSFFSKDINSNGGIFVVPFQLGMDFTIQENEKGVTTFFTQVGFDLNFEDSNKVASELDGNQITIGVRRAY